MKKNKIAWSLEITRPPIEVYSSIEGVRKFEPGETIGLLVNLIDQKGKSTKVTVTNIKPENFQME